MKLHWSPRSPYVRKVMIAAHELGLAEQIDCYRTVASMNQLNPALMVDNPLGKIPALVLDDRQALYDSFVICAYLNDLAGDLSIFPRDPASRLQSFKWHAMGNGLTDLLIIWRNERSKPPERQTAAWLDGFMAKFWATLAALEADAANLSKEKLAIGHIAIGCALSYVDFRFADLNWRAEAPVLTSWYTEFAARPSALATEIVDG